LDRLWKYGIRKNKNGLQKKTALELDGMLVTLRRQTHRIGSFDPEINFFAPAKDPAKIFIQFIYGKPKTPSAIW